jgi:hypothetical protein
MGANTSTRTNGQIPLADADPGRVAGVERAASRAPGPLARGGLVLFWVREDRAAATPVWMAACLTPVAAPLPVLQRYCDQANTTTRRTARPGRRWGRHVGAIVGDEPTRGMRAASRDPQVRR